ncbi:hypothetical protein L7F22_024086 [Adiantum nelumboides]|nr:hypothetical protein [Adiantum nelumboides]
MATSAADVEDGKTSGGESSNEGHTIVAEADKETSTEDNRQNEPVSAFGTGNPFDFSALSGLLNDPSIQELAKQIADDPAFKNMAEELQRGIQPGEQQTLPQINTEEYFNTMQQVMDNPQFMNMAERLSSTLMQDPASANILQNLRSVGLREQVESQWEQVQRNPSLRAIVEEIEREGPATVMKYMNDPEVLSKLGNSLGFSLPEGLSSDNEINGTLPSPGEAIEEELEEGSALHHAASAGDTKALKDLLANGADKAEKDGEGRVALHLACGYGEIFSSLKKLIGVLLLYLQVGILQNQNFSLAPKYLTFSTTDMKSVISCVFSPSYVMPSYIDCCALVYSSQYDNEKAL